MEEVMIQAQAMARGELAVPGGGARAGGLAGGPQLAAGPLGERLHADLSEHLVRGAQLRPRLGPPALAAQPLTVQQVGAGELGPNAGAAEPADRLAVPALGVLAVAEQRPAARVDPLPPVGLADAGRLGQSAERAGGQPGLPGPVTLIAFAILLAAGIPDLVGWVRRSRLPPASDIKNRMRIRDISNPLLVGVHPAAPAGPGRDRVPVFVARDIMAGLREMLLRDRFVLLVGESASGKSRAAYEAIRELFPGGRLVAPPGRDELPARLDVAMEHPGCVLWLDDLERFLGDGGLTRADVQTPAIPRPGSACLSSSSLIRSAATGETASSASTPAGRTPGGWSG